MTILNLARKLRRPVWLAWLIAASICWSLAAISAFGKTIPLLDIAIHFSLQICWISTILAITATIMRRWRHATVMAILVLWQFWLVWPTAMIPTTAARTSGAQLKVIELNAWYWNKRPDDIVAYLGKSNADIVGLVEVSPKLQAALAALYSRYPYHVDCIGADPHCEEVLLSRWPIDRITAGRVDNHLPIVVSARLHLPGDLQVDIVVSHIIRPLNWWLPRPDTDLLPQTAPTLQGEQAALLAKRLAQLGPDAIFLGDLNATPWSPLMKALREAGSWHPETKINPSWPRWGPLLLRLPIDHILSRGQVDIVSLNTGPDLSSDHLPLEADVIIHGKTPE